jgi:hypothetical protein
VIRFGRGRARTAVVIIGALGLLGAYQGVSTGDAGPDPVAEALKISRQQVEAINKVLDVPPVTQSVVPGTLEKRDVAIAAYAAAASPAAGSKPEYAVVWSGKSNIGDMSGNDWMRFVNQGSVSPTGLLNVGSLQWLPGLDAMVVVDVRRSNVDGTANHDYGKVVNFVQVPPPFGVEGEPHHMQYEWQPGQPIVAGHLFTDLTTIWDVSDIPNITLKNVIRPEENPQGTLPDAYDFAGDLAIGTYMGGPDVNYGGSPGSVVVFKPDSARGMVQVSETPAGRVGGIVTGNDNGVPEPCDLAEARPVGTCANPHGIQIRPDLGRMVTNDYADARELVEDPVKTTHQGAFRPTSRIWDISDPVHPRLISVGHMPKSFKNTPNPAHDNIGIMEGAKTYAPAKGFFSGSMCGGGIFFLPDATNVQPDSSSQWKQVWDDGMAEIQVNGPIDQASGNVGSGSQGSEPGACAGGAWHQVSQDNRFMFRAVGGRNPGATNTYDNGAPKMIYVINIEKLVASAADGTVDCSIDSGRELGQGHGDEEDCPTLAGILTVDDNTSGGPHWAALDNFNYTDSGAPTRLMFCDYFVARTGYDGNHRCYMSNVDPQTGALSYDTTFRDEWNGSLGIDFNRADWPGHAGAGFYKPHSMVFVTPEAVAR